MANANVALLVAGLVLVLVSEVCRAQLCSQCECLPETSGRPICARQENTGKYRGFPSRCELDCSNQCRKNKFVFVANRRCGKYLASLSTTTPSPAPAASGPVPVQGSVFGPLLQLLLQAAPSS